MEEKKTNNIINFEETLNKLTVPAMDYDLVSSEEFGQQYANLVIYAKELEEIKKRVDAEIKTILEAEYTHSGKQSVEYENLKLTFIPGTYRESFDSKKFKEEQPDLYQQYVRLSETSASLRTTLKK